MYCIYEYIYIYINHICIYSYIYIRIYNYNYLYKCILFLRDAPFWYKPNILLQPLQIAIGGKHRNHCWSSHAIKSCWLGHWRRCTPLDWNMAWEISNLLRWFSQLVNPLCHWVRGFPSHVWFPGGYEVQQQAQPGLHYWSQEFAEWE